MRNVVLGLVGLFSFSLQAEALHYGAGFILNDEQVYFSDKTYRESFSWDAAIYTDFDKSHSLFFDAHLYRPVFTNATFANTFAYLGAGVIYIKDKDNYVHERSVGEYEANYGFRAPIGIEAIHESGLSLFAEVVPTLIVDPASEYETVFALGARYYFY